MNYLKYGLILLVAAVIIWLQVANSNLKEKNEQLNQQVVSLTASLELQNSAIRKLEADAKLRKQEGDKLVTEAKKVAITHKKKSVEILTATPAVADDCQAALILGNQ